MSILPIESIASKLSFFPELFWQGFLRVPIDLAKDLGSDALTLAALKSCCDDKWTTHVRTTTIAEHVGISNRTAQSHIARLGKSRLNGSTLNRLLRKYLKQRKGYDAELAREIPKMLEESSYEKKLAGIERLGLLTKDSGFVIPSYISKSLATRSENVLKLNQGVLEPYLKNGSKKTFLRVPREVAARGEWTWEMKFVYSLLLLRAELPSTDLRGKYLVFTFSQSQAAEELNMDRVAIGKALRELYRLHRIRLNMDRKAIDRPLRTLSKSELIRLERRKSSRSQLFKLGRGSVVPRHTGKAATVGLSLDMEWWR